MSKKTLPKKLADLPVEEQKEILKAFVSANEEHDAGETSALVQGTQAGFSLPRPEIKNHVNPVTHVLGDDQLDVILRDFEDGVSARQAVWDRTLTLFVTVAGLLAPEQYISFGPFGTAFWRAFFALMAARLLFQIGRQVTRSKTLPSRESVLKALRGK